MNTPDPDTKIASQKGQGPRRSPSADERLRDAERSREALLAAALDEFSARGFAGARVQDIATKAGLNKQLINYYFGGKEGLYMALQQSWLEREEAIIPPDGTLEDVAVAYLQDALDDPRMSRLLVWAGLAEAQEELEGPPGDSAVHEDRSREDLSDLMRRQSEGELAADLDPGLFELALMGAILAPITMPQIVHRITGLDTTSEDFKTRYTDFTRRMLRHLAR